MSSQNDRELYIGCKAYNGMETSYGYVPTKAAGVAFCVLFGLSMLVHIVQFWWKRTWWCSVFAVGCFGMLFPAVHQGFQFGSGANSAQLNYSDGLVVPGAQIAPTIPTRL